MPFYYKTSSLCYKIWSKVECSAYWGFLVVFGFLFLLFFFLEYSWLLVEVSVESTRSSSVSKWSQLTVQLPDGWQGPVYFDRFTSPWSSLAFQTHTLDYQHMQCELYLGKETCYLWVRNYKRFLFSLSTFKVHFIIRSNIKSILISLFRNAGE